MAFNVQNVINRNSEIWRNLAAWPKIEQHRHLEGSLRLETLIDVARQYDNEVDNKIRGLSSAIEPIMTLVMGGALLFIALGIFLPMWNMYSSVK